MGAKPFPGPQTLNINPPTPASQAVIRTTAALTRIPTLPQGIRPRLLGTHLSPTQRIPVTAGFRTTDVSGGPLS